VSDYVFLVHSYEDRLIVINHRATGGRALNDLEDHGISIRRAAKQMGMSASYLSDLLKGRRNWSHELERRFESAVRKIIKEDKL
jgi:transcriptional regulator with XRE-family HTH domain